MVLREYDFPFGIMEVAALLGLRTRRSAPNSVYTDCPICGDKRGKMNLNYVKNTFHCNYCDEGGGMIVMYAKVYGISNSDAYREICEALRTGMLAPAYETKCADKAPVEIINSEPASAGETHQTLSMLLSFLTLTEQHRKNLMDRGLSDEQIKKLGYKSTPPPYLCKSYTDRLIKRGCTVKGVPGFYPDGDGKWTVKFYKRTAGMIIPVKGIDGLVRGAQIRLDVPIKDEGDDESKLGTKYLWLSSSNKHMGVTSGSPVHFVGNPFANTVYVTEGALKGDVAHCLMKRAFVCVAGANNLGQLDPLFAVLAKNGTELIIEAHDMDKYQNAMISKGASRIYVMAGKHGMDSKRLTWNPNHKGVDDWQLDIKIKKEIAAKKEADNLNFKDSFISGMCSFSAIDDCVDAWHNGSGSGRTLREYLGLSVREYEDYLRGVNLEAVLLSQRTTQRFRIYQLEFGKSIEPKEWAYRGIEFLRKAGFEQPPASEYRLTHDAELPHNATLPAEKVLELILARYNGDLPDGYYGRSVAPSDVIELYNDNGRRYFYCNPKGFAEVKFSPKFALPIKAT